MAPPGVQTASAPFYKALVFQLLSAGGTSVLSCAACAQGDAAVCVPCHLLLCRHCALEAAAGEGVAQPAGFDWAPVQESLKKQKPTKVVKYEHPLLADEARCGLDWWAPYDDKEEADRESLALGELPDEA